jgi:hypothetical protein
MTDKTDWRLPSLWRVKWQQATTTKHEKISFGNTWNAWRILDLREKIPSAMTR